MAWAVMSFGDGCGKVIAIVCQTVTKLLLLSWYLAIYVSSTYHLCSHQKSYDVIISMID
ncbi:hypothetical protein LU293_07935 [Moraxella nasovis]|uniref:hypothetical protein n=1 Tax=Moraxella nasovis TaxID=2904121 RepID=UPI001F617B1D|nr:hypothetical protein [Moraxella nasovis]UNU73004.1 hypothetical protein LU293_07935 [Moraxella nasovis]